MGLINKVNSMPAGRCPQSAAKIVIIFQSTSIYPMDFSVSFQHFTALHKIRPIPNGNTPLKLPHPHLGAIYKGRDKGREQADLRRKMPDTTAVSFLPTACRSSDKDSCHRSSARTPIPMQRSIITQGLQT